MISNCSLKIGDTVIASLDEESAEALKRVALSCGPGHMANQLEFSMRDPTRDVKWGGGLILTIERVTARVSIDLEFSGHGHVVDKFSYSNPPNES